VSFTDEHEGLFRAAEALIGIGHRRPWNQSIALHTDDHCRCLHVLKVSATVSTVGCDKAPSGDPPHELSEITSAQVLNAVL